MDITAPKSLASRREQAVRDKQICSIGRLNDEYRLKPGPKTMPAYFYKNPHGNGHIAAFRVAECIPIRSRIKRQDTVKQIQGRKICALKSKMRSMAALTSQQAGQWLDENPLFVGIKTTGLLEDSQVIELVICDFKGFVLYESRFKPSIDIDQGAYGNIGIADDELAAESIWVKQVDRISTILEGRTVVFFNAQLDLRLMRQTSNAFGLDTQWVSDLNIRCVMYMAEDYYGLTNSPGNISLELATEKAGVRWLGAAHSVAADIMASVDLVRAIAGYWKTLDKILIELQRSNPELVKR